ncbi:LNS2 (Lipin/Ned1/Smp2) domain-containing protein [Trichoderma breve]|uniref:LNS2 (Lipin/Ned1/Smp2) domain-containing protein n=1 Tax=Trichoderma breve TaxID=2034170 RepID=A0A9W9BGQ9_9HYPO|nr:LNS2 (Lipin/Ned1/Smp2) domain-containing protein [Trichoderma breve]KAJ4862870.1 LNS2 (Lipin/Ned1/Smp2) domain-containing protein [Trichoderma breve]
MQYVRNLSDSVSTAWNSINPATLSGAIDVIVVERDDGTLACSPFHVRFGKFSLLRPYEKKVEFRINGTKQPYSMKLGEGGEAFFVFETSDSIPESMQTSPLVSPASSPPFGPADASGALQEPDTLELDGEPAKARRPSPAIIQPDENVTGMITPLSSSPPLSSSHPGPGGDWRQAFDRPHSDDILRKTTRHHDEAISDNESPSESERSHSPPILGPTEAIARARALSKGLSAVNIPTHITETGDLMLDMTGFKSNEEDMLRAEVLARNILSEEMDGNYDIGALFGFDEEGNLWVYSSEDAKQAAMNKTIESSLQAHRRAVAADAISDPGYQKSDAGPGGMHTPPRSPTGSLQPPKSYAKTLRLTSDQLKDMSLKYGENSMSFTVNRATCAANLYLWKHDTPVVISDIDGTITKSDALGHVLNMIGRDWTHSGIAKLYSDIALNGYNIMYLTSRSVGQADTTRAYLNNIVQEGFKMPHGPTILSPDRTMAALRREVYLRKPHVFKMATLRDIRNLYGPDGGPFYAGFGNRLTDQISYRTVDVPRTRIFTINSNSEVSLDLLSLNKLKMTYVNINEVVDHYFPPVDTLIDDFSASDSDDDDQGSTYTDEEGDDEEEEEEEEEDDEEVGEGLADSYISHEDYEGDDILESIENDYADDEENYEDEDAEASDDETRVVEDVPAEIITGNISGAVEQEHDLPAVEVPVEIRTPTPS